MKKEASGSGVKVILESYPLATFSPRPIFWACTIVELITKYIRRHVVPNITYLLLTRACIEILYDILTTGQADICS